MDKLWSPWRSKYIESFSGKGNDNECLFCRIASEKNDRENFILHRNEKCYIVLNLFPYNNGHLMIVPYRHCSKLSDLENDEMLEIMKTINLGINILTASIKPQGFNIGANLGRCAGAGIENHIHFHIVPRWNGDTNFMPVISETKVISELMNDTFEKLEKALTSILNTKK